MINRLHQAEALIESRALDRLHRDVEVAGENLESAQNAPFNLSAWLNADHAGVSQVFLEDAK